MAVVTTITLRTILRSINSSGEYEIISMADAISKGFNMVNLLNLLELVWLRHVDRMNRDRQSKMIYYRKWEE